MQGKAPGTFPPDRSATVVPLTDGSIRSKIRSLEELAQVALNARRQGRRVVQCHGVFDLVHLGHVRHLEHARRQGDMLIVTLTADRFVNKGPGRPVFPELQRAEMIAAMSYVDWVAINDAPDAVPAIDAIRPAIYMKGSEYADAAEDVTGKIAVERQIVETHGGQIVFTDDIVFSSSALINQHLNLFDAEVRETLDELRAEFGLAGIVDWVDRIKDHKVLLVGDTIIDEYNYVSAMSKPIKENIIATRFQDREAFAGGVIASANHLASFVREVEIVTCLGGNDSHNDLVHAALKPNVKLTPIARAGSPTTRKLRYVDATYTRKMFEVYFCDDTPLPEALQMQFDQQVASRLDEYDVVIANDYGHGLIAPSTVRMLARQARFLAVNAQSNSANMGFNLVSKYPRADYICIDAPEARLAAAERFADLSEIAGRFLPERIDCERIIITHGMHGCVTYQRGQPTRRMPALTKSVVDTMGAGDAFLAVTAPLMAAGAPIRLAGFIGNVVGALKVMVVGHRTAVDKPSLIKALTSLLK
jgi:rfaE bifunctional protein nucleotidyltransferase chain/domain